jgi:hypothetical protein
VGATVAVMSAGFGPATGSSASPGELAAFLLGTTTVLTVVGTLLTTGLLVWALGPRAVAAAVAAVPARRRDARRARRRPVPAAAAVAQRYG